METNDLKGRELHIFCLMTAVILFAAAFLLDDPGRILPGMWEIVRSRAALVTDYIELAGYGAAFFNAGLMLVIPVAMVDLVHLPYTGLTMAAVFLNVGFAFWGKNPVNIIPILLGTFVYSKIHRQKFARYVYTALFAACLAPFVSELSYILPFSFLVNNLLAVLTGFAIGIIIPPIAAHTASSHMGYSLFNVGFAGGIIAFILYSGLKVFGILSESVFIWKYERHPGLVIGTYVYFAITILYGTWLTGWKPTKALELAKHPGRAVCDFILMDGAGATLINMGFMGIVAETYVLLMGGDMSGPIFGSILAVFGFGSFGAHLKNYIPVLIGVTLTAFLAEMSTEHYAVIIAGLFSVGLSPIAGQYGPIAGVIAGFLHFVVVMSTGQFYGGLNLYNNGFSSGWVALVMVPLIEHYKNHKKLMQHIRKVRKERDSENGKRGTKDR